MSAEGGEKEDPLPPTPSAGEASEVSLNPPSSVSVLHQSLSSASHSLSYPLPCHFFFFPHHRTPPRLSPGVFFIFLPLLFMRAPTPARCYLPLSAASLRTNGSIWCIWQTSGFACHPVVAAALAAARLVGRLRRQSCLDSNSVGSLLVGS